MEELLYDYPMSQSFSGVIKITISGSFICIQNKLQKCPDYKKSPIL